MENIRHLLIRVDATPQIGTGHVMRCIALAQFWQARGGSVTFLSHCENSLIRQRIRDEGFQIISTDNPVDTHEDQKEVLKILKRLKETLNRGPVWVVLDGYHFGPEYQKAVHGSGSKLLVIDDYNHLSEYHADILVNQNINAEDLNYECDPACTLLLGPKHALIRREFFERKSLSRKKNDGAGNILITMGGGNLHIITSKVIKGVSLLDRCDMNVKVAIDPANLHYKNILEALQNTLFKSETIHSVKDMPRHMAWADMAITAGGSTCLELALLGIPFMTVVLAENQKGTAAGFEEKKIAVNLGWHGDVKPDDIAEALAPFFEDRARREKLSARGQVFVDGFGASRVLESMEPIELRLRKAGPGDCETVWTWANDPDIRDASFSTDPISMERHRQWFDKHISLPGYLFYIATNQNSIPVGQARFEIVNGEAMISVSLGREFRRLGLGERLIRKASRMCFRERNVKNIVALIKVDNEFSIQAFERAGYRTVSGEVCNGCESVRMTLKKP